MKENNRTGANGVQLEKIWIYKEEEAAGRTKVHLTHPDGGLYPCMWLDSNGQVKEEGKDKMVLVSVQEILSKGWSIVPGWVE